MNIKLQFLLLLILLAICVGISTPAIAGGSHGQISKPGNLKPENTVILANEMDARFSRDFSVLLKHLRLEWVELDSAVVPDSVQGKNLVILGHPDAEYTGEVIRGLLTAEEIEILQTAKDHHVILEKESPWMEDRTIIICSGASLLQTRNASEEAIRAIIANVPPASEWIRTTYDADLDEDLRDYVTQLQYEWDDTELSLQDLTMEVGANSRGKITPQQAREDVERLFYLFSHGYSGYAFFNREGEFEQAKNNILQELPTQSSWSSDAFAGLLHDHLDFIVDRHMTLGDYKFANHSDFWFDTKLELMLGKDGYQFVDNGTTYTLESINDDDPTSFILPSLNQQGDPIYRLGMLSTEEPPPLLLTAVGEEGERPFEVKLQRSDFDYYSEDIFREDVLGGIPVIRVRAFSDNYSEELNQFVKTASNHRDDPVVIIDIRGNGGGNERWPISWIQRLTGRRAESVFAFSELESKTSMIGRANALAYWDHQVSGPSLYEADADRYTRIAESFESGERQPRWTGPRYPQMPLIANDTTVIVVTNDQVASAGEGLVMRISQAENVVVVGENSMGALTFGNLSAHQLPHSGLMVWFSINFGLYLDQEFREGVGLAPDLWVPAEEAVNYAVAAVRQGTIPTSMPLPPALLQQDFVPESLWARVLNTRYLLVVAFLSASGSVWAYFMRKKPHIVARLGVIWLLFGIILMAIYPKRPVGIGVLLVGLICLVWGGINLLKARQAPLESDG